MRPESKDAATTRLEARVARFIADEGLFAGVRRLGLAVSGGSDSLALLHLLPPLCRAAGVEPVVLTFDHAIPGEHSDEDARFVRDAAARLDLPFYGEKSRGLTTGGGQSLEMAARAARQAFFRRAAQRFGLDAVATAHQADDVAETLLLRLLRGAGATGLSGLRPRSTLPAAAPGEAPLVLVRPLLPFRREELRGWLRAQGLVWCEDPSNANVAIPRNGVRHVLLPALTRAVGDSDVIDALARSAAILREEDTCLERLAADWLASASADAPLPLARLRAEAPLALQRRAARAWLLRHVGGAAAGYDAVAALLALGEGDALTLPGGMRVRMASGDVRLVEETPPPPCPPAVRLPVPGVVSWGNFRLSARPGGDVVRPRTALGSWPAEATISAARLAGRPLIVRGRRSGDHLRPYGLDGTKKLQDVFVDAKVPAAARDTYPVVALGEGDVVWLPGYRIAAAFAVRGDEPVIRLRAETLAEAPLDPLGEKPEGEAQTRPEGGAGGGSPSVPHVIPVSQTH